MKKSELLQENERLKADLKNVCEHHIRLTKILHKKIDEICKLKKQVKNAKEIKSQRN